MKTLGIAVASLLAAACAWQAAETAKQDPDYEKLLKAATFTLSEAIDRALAVKEAKDCVVVNAEIEEEDGKIIYSIELAKGNKILEVNFDVTTGAILPLENEDHDKSAQAKAAKVTVKDAIATATKTLGTRPIEASLVMKEGKPVCEVKVLTASKSVLTVTVDALTGEVTKSESLQKKNKAAQENK